MKKPDHNKLRRLLKPQMTILVGLLIVLLAVALFAADLPVRITVLMVDALYALSPVYHPVSLVLIAISVVASRTKAASERRGFVLATGIGVAVMMGTVCSKRHLLRFLVVPLLHPVIVVPIIVAAFAWFSSKMARRKGVLLFVGVIVAVAIGELCGRLFFTMSRIPRLQRAALAGIGPDEYYQNCVSHPYLLYASAPNFRRGKNWHNGDGYRGNEVPMKRSENTMLVLCLGGSTTYGVATEAPEEAFPAVLGDLLNDDLPIRCRRVEVINGGLPFATTAELVAHYHFKFQYYSPDVVVINTGGNDAWFQKSTWKYYQPDYTHLRQSFSTPQPLSPFGKMLLKSALASILILPLNTPPTINSMIDRRDVNQPPRIQWHPAGKKPGLISSLPDDQLGYTRNLKRLIQMVISDGGDVVLVPFRIAPGGEIQEDREQCDRNESILKELARANKLPVAPFPLDCITPGNWVDGCHLNAAGCREKAQHISTYVRDVLSARARRSSTTSKTAE